MSKLNPKKHETEQEDKRDAEEYEMMDLLERLETLREDMEDLGVTTLAEVNERIQALHAQIEFQSPQGRPCHLDG